MRFTKRDKKEMLLRGLITTDPNKGRCRRCGMIIWYSEMATDTAFGYQHESCLARAVEWSNYGEEMK